MIDTVEARAAIQSCLREAIGEYRRSNGLTTDWKEPIVGFADANGKYIRSLRAVVSPTHYLPQDFLPECTVIISYFLPFIPAIGISNLGADEPSREWVAAYNETNRMFPELNERLIQAISELGYRAVSPGPVGMIDDEHIYSNWSQRHIAYAAGLGTFGINNMLITSSGACGRLYSLISDLPVMPDAPLTNERCLYKRSGICGLCIKKCPVQALDAAKPFDRRACAARLDGLDKKMGADVCGKCTVGLPCTFNDPSRNM